MTHYNHPSVLAGQDDERIQQMIDDQLAKPLADSERRLSRKALNQLHPGNRFRLMAGLSMLPEDDGRLEEKDPWDMGEQAHERGSKLTDNPFPEKTFQHCRWMCGWISADNPPPPIKPPLKSEKPA